MKKISFVFVVMLFVSLGISSCKKDPGTGGNSSVFGKVYVKDYNGTFTVLEDEYYGPDIDVYIIYGDDMTYDDHVKTNYDGTFEFKYLRPGKYHVYAYSKDSTLQTNAVIPVIKDIEITKNKQSVETPEIEIFK
jgi:hypothetical protein